MDFFDKLSGVVKSAADMANDSFEMNKLIGDANLQRGNIEVYKRELGEIYWAKYATGEKLEDEAMLICDKIVVAQDKIRALEAEIEQIKADREAEKAERKAEREAERAERKAAKEAEKAERKAAEEAAAAAAASAAEIIDLPEEEAKEMAAAETAEPTETTETAEPAARKPVCGACGAALAEGQNFCGICGKAVE